MRTGLIISLGGSAALGLLAIAVARLWDPPGEQRAASRVAAEAHLVPVVVATEPLKYGLRLERRHLSLVRVPADAAPNGGFTTIDQALNPQRVVLVPMAAREPLLPSKLSGPGARAIMSAEIEADKRAFTIRVSDITGVGGHVLPGDRVDVVLTRDLSEDARSRNLVSTVLLQNVRVLGIDLNADPTTDKPAAPHNATLEVSPADTQKLAVAVELGSLSLALRRAGAAELADVQLITASDVAGAQLRGLQAAPARARARSFQTGVPRAPSGQTPLTIVNGSTKAEVWVQPERSGAGA